MVVEVEEVIGWGETRKRGVGASDPYAGASIMSMHGERIVDKVYSTILIMDIQYVGYQIS